LLLHLLVAFDADLFVATSYKDEAEVTSIIQDF